MSPSNFLAAVVSAWALAWSAPVVAAQQDADGIGAFVQAAPAARIGSSYGSQDVSGRATYAPTVTPEDAYAQAGIDNGWAPSSLHPVQVSSWTHGRWSVASVISASDNAPQASMGNVPVAWNTQPWNSTSDSFAPTFTPVVASYRISATDRIALSLVQRGRGNYSSNGRYLGPTNNVWGLVPKVAYTRVVSSPDQDSSTVVAVGSFSHATVANFQGCAVGRIEALMMQKTSSGWGYGGVAAAIEQPNTGPLPLSKRPLMLNNDTSTGMALGVGPQISWSSRWLGSGVDFQYRWVYEFRGPNGHTDQPMLLSATLHL